MNCVKLSAELMLRIKVTDTFHWKDCSSKRWNYSLNSIFRSLRSLCNCVQWNVPPRRFYSLSVCRRSSTCSRSRPWRQPTPAIACRQPSGAHLLKNRWNGNWSWFVIVNHWAISASKAKDAGLEFKCCQALVASSHHHQEVTAKVGFAWGSLAA